MGNQELRELYNRITHIKEPKVSYLAVNSYDKDTRQWAKISKRAVFDQDTQRWKRNTMFVDDLDKWEQVQLNTDELLNGITFDVDEPTLFMYPDDVAPYTVTRNKTDDNFHTTYLLNKPFYAKSDKQKRILDNEVKPQIKRLALSLGADGRYTNITTKNSFNTRLFTTTTTQQTIPDVWHLLNLYVGELKKFDSFDVEAVKDNKYHSEQYKEAIFQLIEHSKLNIRLLTKAKDETQFRLNMKLFSEQLDIQGIKEASMLSILNDVIDRALYLSADFVSLQKIRSKKAHLARYGNQVEQNKLNIKEAIYLLVSKGLKPTLKNIAPLVNLSVSTLKQHYNQHIRIIKQSIAI